MDQHYLDKVRAGDVEAFRYFVAKYQDRAFSIAMGVLHRREDAEEAVQDAFVKAFQGLEKFRGDAQFSSWLHRIVVNEALRRAQKNNRQAMEVGYSSPEEAIVPDLDTAVLQLEQKERARLVRQLLAQLKPKETLVLQLHYLHELSIQEIEAHTGFSNAQIKVLLHRGRRSFSALFQEKYQKELLP